MQIYMDHIIDTYVEEDINNIKEPLNNIACRKFIVKYASYPLTIYINEKPKIIFQNSEILSYFISYTLKLGLESVNKILDEQEKIKKSYLTYLD